MLRLPGLPARESSGGKASGAKSGLPGSGVGKGAKTKRKGKSLRKQWAELVQQPWVGIAVFGVVLVIVALFSGLDVHDRSVRLFLAGEIATQDVSANQDLFIEDPEATRNKRDQTLRAIPPVFDLALEGYANLRDRVVSVLDRALAAETGAVPGAGEASAANVAGGVNLDTLRWQLAEELDTEVDQSAFALWRQASVQYLIMERVLPWLEERMGQGVLSDLRAVQPYARTGILVRDLERGSETLRAEVAQIATLSTLAHELDGFLRQGLKKDLRTRRAVMTLVEPLLEPTLTINRETTEARKEQALTSVEPVYYHVKKGEVIVRQGERVTPKDQIKLSALADTEAGPFHFQRPLGVFVLGALFALGLLLSPTGRIFEPLRNRDAVMLAVTILFFTALAKGIAFLEGPLASSSFSFSREIVSYCFPLAGMGGVLALFFRLRTCFVANLLAALLCSWMLEVDVPLFAYYLFGAMLYTLLVKRAQTRPALLRSVFPLLLGLYGAWVGASLLQFKGATWMAVEILFVTGGGLLSLLILLGLSPIFELVFTQTSRFRLMELMNLEQRLLQELMVSAPGTYHHSLIVSNMVEAGARAIGANALLCKVGALYHDIGKLHNPEYFIENQYRGKNKHDKLSPSMSALILISHVKKGEEMAKSHRLGQEIADIIRQHHGTSLINFFFHKAKEQAAQRGDEPPSDRAYRYPGPRPQSKEAALVMLADAIEASSRVLGDPAPGRLKGHIDTISKKIFAEGQLDESALTFKDLHLLNEAFRQVMVGLYHQRIDYPGATNGKGAKADKAGPDKGDKGDKGDKPVSDRADKLEKGVARIAAARGNGKPAPRAAGRTLVLPSRRVPAAGARAGQARAEYPKSDEAAS